MTTESREFKKKNKPKIRMLKSGFGNSAGDIVNVHALSEKTVSYYDGFRRWCYLWVSEEGDLWEWVKRPTDDM